MTSRMAAGLSGGWGSGLAAQLLRDQLVAVLPQPDVLTARLVCRNWAREITGGIEEIRVALTSDTCALAQRQLARTAESFSGLTSLSVSVGFEDRGDHWWNDQAQNVDPVLAFLLGLRAPQVAGLSCRRRDCPDSLVGLIGGLTDLRRLHLDFSQYYDRTLRGYDSTSIMPLTTLTGLESLRLSNSHTMLPGSFAGLSCLTNLRSLSFIRIFGTLPERELSTMASSLSNLQVLHLYPEVLYGGVLPESGLSCLSPLANLRELGVGGFTCLPPRWMSQLALFPRLETLHVKAENDICTKDHPSGCLTAELQHLHAPPHLRSLNLSRSQYLSDDGLACLARLTGLTSLDLSYCCPNPGRSRGLPKAGYRPLTLGTLGLLSLSSLTHLNMTGCSYVSDAGVAHLESATKLKCLLLNGCRDLTDVSLRCLSGLTALEVLSLAAIPNLSSSALTQLPDSIRQLDVVGCGGQLLQGLGGALGHLGSLEHLSLGHSTISAKAEDVAQQAITDTILGAELSVLPDLEKITLQYCQALSREAVLSATSAMHSLREIVFQNWQSHAAALNDRVHKKKLPGALAEEDFLFISQKHSMNPTIRAGNATDWKQLRSIISQPDDAF